MKRNIFCLLLLSAWFCGAASAQEAPCPVEKTGQNTSYRTGDDGDLQPGAAWPDPRFTDNGDGTVLDNLTGLEWVKAPHGLPGNSGTMGWDSAVDFCSALSYAGHDDWRLPSIRELQSLVDYGRYQPALPSGHPFTGVQDDEYCSGTSVAFTYYFAWSVDMSSGYVTGRSMYAYFYVWPVRPRQ